jgi:hypothetical protein
MIRTAIKGIVLLGGLAVLGEASAQHTFAYPPAGRTADQQRQDQYECHAWAVDQSHFDPVASASGTPAPAANGEKAGQGPGTGGALVGGAVRGAAVAKLADDDTTDGARAGAALGLLRQRRAQAAAAREHADQQRASKEQQAQVQAKQQAYERAKNTCLKARGYTLSEG